MNNTLPNLPREKKWLILRHPIVLLPLSPSHYSNCRNFSAELDSRITIANSPVSSPVTSGPAFSHTQQQQQVRQQQQQQSYAAVGGKVNDERPDELSTSRKAEPTHYTPIVENSGTCEQ